MKTTTAFIDQPTSLPLVAFFRYPSILSTILGKPVREENQRALLGIRALDRTAANGADGAL